MATLAQSLNAVAADLLPLVDSLSARSDPKSQADAKALGDAMNRLLSDAMQANTQNLETKLAGDAGALQRLTTFSAQADAKARQLAASEANVSRFVSLATHVGALIVAGATGNIAGCAGALLAASGDLGIHT